MGDGRGLVEGRVGLWGGVKPVGCEHLFVDWDRLDQLHSSVLRILVPYFNLALLVTLQELAWL